MATLRAIKDEKRVATGRRLQDGQIYQVYPFKETYSSEKVWLYDIKHRIGGHVDEVDVSYPEKKPRKSPVHERRQEQEMREFLDASYSDMFKFVGRSAPSRVRVFFHNGSVWDVERSLNFLEPPRVWKNGVDIGCNYEYSPALTSVRWLLMVAFVNPDMV